MEEVPGELVESARKGKRDAVVELLAIHYPLVWRMATGLTGRADVGRGAAKFVMQRSLRVLHTWKDDGAPTRWFLHHTVLTTRRAHKHQPDLSNDVFLRGESSDPAFVAFVRALRTLPMQQREAFILSRGERLDIRTVAVAMDCSTTAATNHLEGATDRLKMLSPRDFDAHVQRVYRAYQSIGPDEELALKDVRRNVRRWVWPWMIGKTLKMVLGFVLLLVIGWGAWWVWKIVRHSLE